MITACSQSEVFIIVQAFKKSLIDHPFLKVLVKQCSIIYRPFQNFNLHTTIAIYLSVMYWWLIFFVHKFGRLLYFFRSLALHLKIKSKNSLWQVFRQQNKAKSNKKSLMNFLYNKKAMWVLQSRQTLQSPTYLTHVSGDLLPRKGHPD